MLSAISNDEFFILKTFSKFVMKTLSQHSRKKQLHHRWFHPERRNNKDSSNQSTTFRLVFFR